MSLAEIKQYLDWNKQGDKTIQLRYDMFLQRRAAVEQQLRDIQRTLAVVDFKIKYYARALRAGTMSTDHALMAGVPARQIGWVCECGERLPQSLECPMCMRKYELQNGKCILKK